MTRALALATVLAVSSGGPGDLAYDGAVAAVLRAHDADAERCLPRDHDGGVARGTIVVRWRIDADGRAADVEVVRPRTTLSDDAATACLTHLIAALQFPKPRGDGVAWVTWSVPEEPPVRIPPRVR